MVIALIGSHGTGKTEVFKELQKQHPEYLFFSEGVRHQTPAFGYKSPYDMVDEFGVGVFEVMNINSWSVIDPAVNHSFDSQKTVITDRSSIDNYAYYLTLKKTDQDAKLEGLIKRMAMHYASLVDRFVYFPLGVFPLENDEMRQGDENYQFEVDKNIHISLKELKVDPNKIHNLSSVSITDRANEILALI